MRILVAEDDEQLARALVLLLGDTYVVDVAATGAEALALLAAGRYDALILDWNLPEVDGLQICRHVRAENIAAAVLMLTARSDPREKVMALTAGADDYVVKPFETAELAARVRALLRRPPWDGAVRPTRPSN